LIADGDQSAVDRTTGFADDIVDIGFGLLGDLLIAFG
jgi:hypothetical protein